MSAKAPREARPAAPSPARALTAAPALRLQRRCACGGTPAASGECEECRKKRLQRSAAGPAAGAVPPIVDRVLRSPGAPLDGATRGFMESRLGHDLSRVRVHDDAAAAESARAVHAHAYTVGEDVVFAAGKHDPRSAAGLHLLAHELAHTVQQRGLQRSAADLAIGGPLEPQLEREAESAARAVMAGGGPGLPVTRPAVPVLSRAPADPVPPAGVPTSTEEPVRDWEDAPSQVKALGAARQSKLQPGVVSPTIRAYRFATLVLPPEKGPVLDRWKQLAQGGGLQAIIGFDGNPKAALKQERPGPERLRRIWLDKVKWSLAEAPALWEAAGGKKSATFEPKVGKETCDADHVIELQMGGNNAPENIQFLDSSENAKSGRDIFRSLKTKAAEIRGAVPGLKEVILYYDQVSQPSSLCQPNTCCAVEQKAVTLSGAAPAGAAAAAPTEPYGLTAGVETSVDVPAGSLKPKKSLAVPLDASSISRNRAAATLIPGMVLDALKLKPAGADSVDAFLDTKNDKTRLPLDIKKEDGKVSLSVDPATRQLKLSEPSKHKRIAFVYPYLSKGTITELQQTPEGLAGKGTLTPSIPFLSKMVLGVAFGPGRLEITSGLDQEKISPPFPGAKLTRAQLALALFPEFKPSGAIELEYAPGGKKVLDAALTAEKDAEGFVARGTMHAYLPGVDNAEGTIQYRNRQWSGGITLESTQIKLPYVKSGTVTVAFTEKGISPQGSVVLEVPGGNVVEVQLHNRDGKWVYTGKGVFKIPRLNDATIAVTYDGEKLSGTGKTGFSLYGLNGSFNVHYSATKGGESRVWGDGTIAFKKKRAEGSLNVKMSPAHKFSGEGSLTYMISESLVASAGIAIDENEKLTLKGALVFPKPIPLFNPIEGHKRLFTLPDIKIPIPGASIGPVGLQVRIGAHLDANYAIGPAELRNARIEAAFNPLEDKPDLDVVIAAKLYIGARAGISASVRGSIAIDVAVASLSGGLTVMAAAELLGKLESDLLVHYQKSRFDLKADSEISAGLVLRLGLLADVTAEAGVGPFTVSTTKEWELGAFSFDTGLKFGMKAKLYYASDQPFKLPSADEIEWIKPELKLGDMLERIMHSAKTKGDEK